MQVLRLKNEKAIFWREKDWYLAVCLNGTKIEIRDEKRNFGIAKIVIKCETAKIGAHGDSLEKQSSSELNRLASSETDGPKWSMIYSYDLFE